jgi:hypothetical protein
MRAVRNPAGGDALERPNVTHWAFPATCRIGNVGAQTGPRGVVRRGRARSWSYRGVFPPAEGRRDEPDVEVADVRVISIAMPVGEPKPTTE